MESSSTTILTTTSTSSTLQAPQCHGQAPRHPQTFRAACVCDPPYCAATLNKGNLPSSDQGPTSNFRQLHQQAGNLSHSKQAVHQPSGGSSDERNSISSGYHQTNQQQHQQMQNIQQQLVLGAHAPGGVTYGRGHAPADFRSQQQQQQQQQAPCPYGAASQEGMDLSGSTAAAAAVAATGSQDSSNTRWVAKMPSLDLECDEDLALPYSCSMETLLSDDNMEEDDAYGDDWTGQEGMSVVCDRCCYPSAKARLGFAEISIYNDMNSPRVLEECNDIMQSVLIPGKHREADIEGTELWSLNACPLKWFWCMCSCACMIYT